MREMARRSVLVATAAALATLAGCAGGGERRIAEIRLATGPAGAVYRRIGGGFVDLLAQRLPGTTVTALPTRASTDNIGLLRSGAADLGLCSLDAVVGPDGEPPEGVLAVGRLYDSFLHLVVTAESSVRSFADLAGARVSFGAGQSGTEFTSRRLVDLAGLVVDDVRLDQADSARALAAGSVDALFSLTGLPTPAIADLAAARALRFVPLQDQAAQLADAYPGPYVPSTIPATAYDGIPATPTVAVPNVLLARADLPDAVADIVAETVFTGAAELVAERPVAQQVNVRTGISTGPVPLHPGAAAWFRRVKR